MALVAPLLVVVVALAFPGGPEVMRAGTWLWTLIGGLGMFLLAALLVALAVWLVSLVHQIGDGRSST
jgi:hypothetical protein